MCLLIEECIMNRIGEFVKKSRKAAGLTQKEFAMRSGLGLRFVRELEQGKETVRMDKVNSVYNSFIHPGGNMKKIIQLFALACILLPAAACADNKAPSSSSSEEPAAVSGIHHAEIKIKDYGTITVELDADTAPVSVGNFMNLAESGFYDGKTFHRIIDGFMIQGGADPTGTVPAIKGEFSSNGVENNIKHVTGVISMARARDKNSATSQFFIMVGDADWLDGEYAAFGHVTEGLDIALKIASDAVPVDNNGTIPSDEQPVIESIRVTD